jgi:hypothetical protein
VIDDGDRFNKTLELIGSFILATLNALEQHSLLKPASPISNIPLIMSVTFSWVEDFSDYHGDWPTQIVAYAEKAKIPIKGVHNVEEILEGYIVEKLERADKKKVMDPPKADKFGFTAKVCNCFMLLLFLFFPSRILAVELTLCFSCFAVQGLRTRIWQEKGQ